MWQTLNPSNILNRAHSIIVNYRTKQLRKICFWRKIIGGKYQTDFACQFYIYWVSHIDKSIDGKCIVTRYSKANWPWGSYICWRIRKKRITLIWIPWICFPASFGSIRSNKRRALNKKESNIKCSNM